MKSSRVWPPRYSRMACWPSSQASCRAQGAPVPQARFCMMQRVTPKGPSTASTASRSVISRGRTREAGAPAAALFALDQPGAGEVGQDAGEQAARDVRLGGDPVRRRLLPHPGEVHQGPQSVPSLAAQLQLQTLTPLRAPSPCIFYQTPSRSTALDKGVPNITPIVIIMWVFERRGGVTCQGVRPRSDRSVQVPCRASIWGRGLAPARGERVAGRATQRQHLTKGRRPQPGLAGHEGRRQARGAFRAGSYLARRSGGTRPLCGGGRGRRGRSGDGARVRRRGTPFGRGVGRRRLPPQHRGGLPPRRSWIGQPYDPGRSGEPR